MTPVQLVETAETSYYRRWTPETEAHRDDIVGRLRQDYEGDGVMNKGVCPYPAEQLAVFVAEVPQIGLMATQDEIFTKVYDALVVFARMINDLNAV